MSEKIKAYSEGSQPKFPSSYDVPKRVTLNFTDIIKNNNKFYNIELQLASNGESRVYTNYGRVGANPAKEYRMCSSQSHAEEVIAKIIKDKTKKGYVEVKLVKADIGSEVGKSKIEAQKVSAETLEKSGIDISAAKDNDSKLNKEVQSLIRTWFGDTEKFIEINLDTKKCPLGQLGIDQITKGKDILGEARKIVNLYSDSKIKKSDMDELNRLTSLYYSNIPHVLGRKIDADLLRFDAITKIEKSQDILDVFADAKSVEKVLSQRSSIDSQYETLKADIDYLDSSDPIYKWIEKMLLETRANNHSYLGKLKVHKIFKLARNKEQETFEKNAELIAKECGKQLIPDVLRKFVPERPDISGNLVKLYKEANILPVWHGTRRANMIGITTKGLLIRPSGVAHAGSMYGDGIYWATNSSKSINYTDAKGSYWAGGNASTAYLFLGDVAFGNCKVANGSHFYTKQNIKPNHSVFAKAGGAVYNDELITYEPTGANQQHALRYIVEFETLAR